MKTSNTRRPLSKHVAERQDNQPFFSHTPEELKKKDDAFFQTKTEVGGKDDKFEKEADAVADKVQKKAEEEQEKPVVQKKEEEEKPSQAIAGMELKEQAEPVQKKEDKEDEKPVQKQEKEEEPPIQKMSAPDKEEEKPVQKKTAEHAALESSGMTEALAERPALKAGKLPIEDRLRMSKGKGMPLPDDILSMMEDTFNADLSKVRIHTGADAISMNKDLHSLAFTNGYDIYFDAGQYQPYTVAGKQLLAHELTHVVQQNAPLSKNKNK